MKKLLSILGAVGIVASSATTVVACGGGSKENTLSQYEQDVISSTEDITRAMILSKSENLGNNIVDALWGGNADVVNGLSDTPSKIAYWNSEKKSPKYLDRIYIANGISNKSEAESNGVERSQKWSSAFGTKTLNPDDSSYLMNDASSSTVNTFINDSKLVKDGESNIENSLDYLLSDQTRGEYDGTSTKGISNWTTNKVSSDLEDAVVAMNTASNTGGDILQLMNDMSPSKVSSLLMILQTIVPLSATQTVPSTSHADDNNTNAGNLRQMFFGNHTKSEGWADGFVDFEGDETGMIPVMFEAIYNILKQNKGDIISSGVSEELYDYLVGSSEDNKNSDGNYVLVTNMFKDKNGNTMASDSIDSWGAGSNPDSKFFTAKPDTGLFGDVINAIGDLKWHRSDGAANSYADKLTGENNLGLFNGTEVLLIDNDMVDVMKKTIKLYEVAKPITSIESIKSKVTESLNTGLKGLKNIAGALGLDTVLTGENVTSAMSMLMEIGKLFLNDNVDLEISKDTSVKDIDDAYNADNAFGLDTVKKLQDAISSIKTEHYNDPLNDDYREAIYEALGVKNEESYIGDNSFVKKIGELLRGYRDLFFPNQISFDWGKNIFDENFMGSNVWILNNESTNYEGDVLKSVTYTIEYDGLGNNKVAQFKSSDDVLNMSQQEVFDKLNNTDEDSTAWKQQYNGSGNYTTSDETSDYSQVSRQYTVTWTNVSADASLTDFRLSDFTNELVKIGNDWKQIKY